jgi:hypothetical protein
MCGAPQNPDKRYFPTPEQQKRVDGHTYEGSDRHCPSCKAPMAAKAQNCTQCGSPLDGAKEVRGFVAPRSPAFAGSLHFGPVAPKQPKRRIWPWVVAILLLLCVAIWWVFIRTREAQMTVTAHRWERSIALEEYGNHAEGAWRDQVPADAQAPVCHAKQRSTNKIADGEDCHTERHDKKDGTFEQVRKCSTRYRNEPVMSDWCDFTVRRWNPAGKVSSSGLGNVLAWPATDVPATAPQAMGAKRQGARTETLKIDFGDKSCDVDDATWRKYSDGQKVKVEVRARSGEIVCSSL